MLLRPPLMSRQPAPSLQRVTLERPLAYPIKWGVNRVTLHAIPDTTTTEVGVEGITFSFKHELYAGHHLERGWNGIEFRQGVRDSWAQVRRAGGAGREQAAAGGQAARLKPGGTGCIAQRSCHPPALILQGIELVNPDNGVMLNNLCSQERHRGQAGPLTTMRRGRAHSPQ